MIKDGVPIIECNESLEVVNKHLTEAKDPETYATVLGMTVSQLS